MTEPIPARAVPRGDLEDHVRPLSVGDLLDVALRLYRRHFKAVFLVMLAVELPAFVVQRFYENAIHEMVHEMVSLQRLTLGADPVRAFHPAVLAEVLALFGLLLVFYGVAQGAVILAGADAWHGRPVTSGRTFRSLWPRLPALLVTYVLVLVLVSLAMCLGALPGLAAAIGGIFLAVRHGAVLGGSAAAAVGTFLVMAGMIAAALFLYLRWYVTVPAVVLEGRSAFGALRRSARLMSGRVGEGFFGLVKVRGSLLLLVVFFLLLVPQAILGVPHYLLMSHYAPAKGVLDPLAVPFAMRLPLEIGELLLGTVVTPFGVLATLAFYFDLRVRREGYDLELRGRALGRGEG